MIVTPLDTLVPDHPSRRNMKPDPTDYYGNETPDISDEDEGPLAVLANLNDSVEELCARFRDLGRATARRGGVLWSDMAPQGLPTGKSDRKPPRSPAAARTAIAELMDIPLLPVSRRAGCVRLSRRIGTSLAPAEVCKANVSQGRRGNVGGRAQ